MKFVKSQFTKISIWLKKEHTNIGRAVWILNSIFVIFYVNFILKILLQPYGFLDEFIVAIIAVSNFLLAVILFLKNIELWSFLDKKSILQHMVFSLVLIFVYYLSIGYIWKNKKVLIK